MRDALSLLDVCLSYTDGEVTAQLARDVLGTAGRGAMFDFADALIDGDAGAALTQIDQVMRRGSDPQVFIRDTIAHLRAIMLAGAVREGLSDILEITPEDAKRFADQAARTDADGLNRMLELFMRAEPDTKWASRPRTILELAAVRACHPEKEADASISERVSRVEKLIEKGIPAAPRTAPAKKEAPAPEKPTDAAPRPSPRPAADPPREYLDAIRQFEDENPSVRSPMASMRFIGFDGQRVTVEFAKNRMMHMKLLERKKALLDAALTEAFGAPVSIAMVLEGSALPEKKLNDVARDVINQSYDVFGRENIDLTD
jgi:DNA polymerase-3 subunit gamma/tau